jgi:lyso-ornithine lipid O-acyltransferase
MLRVALVAAAVAAITVTLIPLQWLSLRLRLPTRRAIPVAYHRMLCALLGVRVRVAGERFRQHPLLIVANHVSWLDICVLTTLAPVVFVAKREVRSWPLFGLLARLQRSVFVDRDRRLATAATNAEIAARLAEGDPVVLFAEGTSSDGNRVLPFRSSLIGGAHAALANAEHAARVWIQPLSIAYVALDGLPLGRTDRPCVAWYGDLDLLPHLAHIMRRGAVDVVVSWGEPVACAATTDRKALARSLEATVRRMTVSALRSSLRAEGEAIQDGGAAGLLRR